MEQCWRLSGQINKKMWLYGKQNGTEGDIHFLAEWRLESRLLSSAAESGPKSPASPYWYQVLSTAFNCVLL